MLVEQDLQELHQETQAQVVVELVLSVVMVELVDQQELVVQV